MTTKTATKKPMSALDAQTIVDQLETKKSELAAAAAADESEMAAVAYAAHTGCQKSEAKLETLREDKAA